MAQSASLYYFKIYTLSAKSGMVELITEGTMGFFDKVKAAVTSAQSKLPEDMNSLEEIKAKAQALSQQHGDQINKVADTVQDKIPGKTDDTIIDAAQKKLDELNKK